MKNYDHKEIEKRWQAEWDASGLYKVEDKVSGKQNQYTLVEFSYPSGNLHVGHWYAFSVPDMYARYRRMKGYNVLYPMGFDAFGLPAENAAIKLGEDPKTWTYAHMEKMRGQLRSMGACFDWTREVVTCDPAYYKWTQWMFTEFLKKDLVYRATTKVNWCPKDKTVLANEQVNNGTCDRCGAEVIQKDQDQWMFRITKYADRLVDDLEGLDWPEHIKEAQRNWIGRSVGAEIEFTIKDSKEKIKVFTTRADTLHGVTYVVLAPEHGLVDFLKLNIQNWDEVQTYISDTKKKSDLDRQQSKEKTGVELKGITAINPATLEEVPVWLADYVLVGYATGAVMAVPAHDERDAEFAKIYGLKVADKPLVDKLEVTKKVGGNFVNTYRLRDWGISRQRYWGCPIPIVYDPQGKAHGVPEEHLPWLLPTDVDHTPDGTAPLARSEELKKRTIEIFGEGWTPEVETMDTFVDSSWYFYRYLDPKNEKKFAGESEINAWMPVNTYFGGAEHTTMHLLYSRFWVKAMHDTGMVNETEPYLVRRNRGLILGPDGEKMSKSKGNVIDPDESVKLLGADTVRLYLAFMGPYGDGGNYPWDPNGVVGVRRFLERVWKFAHKEEPWSEVSDVSFQKQLAKTIKKVSEDFELFKFNTCISSMMILLNVFEKDISVSQEDFKTFLKLLAPFAPHITEELWHDLGEKESIHLSIWPVADPKLLVDDEMKIIIQTNGKMRGEILVSVDTTEEEIKNLALSQDVVSKALGGASPKNVIYVKGRLINIVF